VPDPALHLAFAGAVVLLMLIPGPNVALIVANSIAYGSRYGLLTVAGTSSAMVPQLILAGLGLSGLMDTLGVWFDWVRWAGVVYLVWLGIRQWRAPAAGLSVAAEPKSWRAIYVRAFLVSLTNPKTLLFYGAFFPQFLSEGRAAAPQIVVLSLTFLTLAVLVDGSWALAAGRARGLIARRGRLANKLSGGLLVGAGVGLALARQK
jgi:threonine/homoserine/homoserine lactone efflux protein